VIKLESYARSRGLNRFGLLGLASVSMMVAPTIAAASDLVPVANSLRHPEVKQASTTSVSPEENVFFAISIQPRDPAGLEAFVKQVSNPYSPEYRNFLTPEEVGAKFGPTQAVVDNEVEYLNTHGLTVREVAKNGFVIIAEGNAARVSETFQTHLAYARREDGTSYRTNLTALHMPAELAKYVISIDGIDTSIRRQRRLLATTTTTLNPTLYRACYNASTGYSAGYYGAGVRIAIANWDGYRLANIPEWTSKYSLPVPSGGSGSNITVREVGTGATYGQGAPGGEGDLDLQAVLMAAPLASVYDYDDATSDTAAPITTYTDIVNDNTADIVTESYGWETSDNSTYYGSTWTSAHNLHLSMAAQGITYLAATGDTGTGNFPSRGVRYGYPDIDPDVLMVGGSIATVNSTTGVRSSEASWGLSGGDGGTGGFDPYDTSAHGFAFNVAPSYQTSYISSKTKTYNYRLVPDMVSSAGGQNGLGQERSPYSGWALEIFYDDPPSYPLGTLIQIDGTSIASPATAGSLGAVEDQVFAGVTPNGTRSNVRFGLMQPYLYAIGSNTSVFYDITTGSSIGNLPGTSTAATPAAGWDFATGWGAFNFGGLVTYIKNSGTLP